MKHLTLKFRTREWHRGLEEVFPYFSGSFSSLYFRSFAPPQAKRFFFSFIPFVPSTPPVFNQERIIFHWKKRFELISLFFLNFFSAIFSINLHGKKSRPNEQLRIFYMVTHEASLSQTLSMPSPRNSRKEEEKRRGKFFVLVAKQIKSPFMFIHVHLQFQFQFTIQQLTKNSH